MLIVLATTRRPDQRHGQPARAHLVDVLRQSVARGPADPRREHLDADHQRPGQEQRPDQRIAELGAGLRVGGDAAGVVVGGAGDEPGAEAGGEAGCARLAFVRLVLRSSPLQLEASASSTTSTQWRTASGVPLCRCWMQPMLAETMVSRLERGRVAELAVAQRHRQLGMRAPSRCRPSRSTVRFVHRHARPSKPSARRARLDAAAQLLAVLQRARRMERQPRAGCASLASGLRQRRRRCRAAARRGRGSGRRCGCALSA